MFWKIQKANNAATGSGIIYFFTYLPYIFISLRYETLTLGMKIGSCFISNLAMCLGVQIIGIFEGHGTGVNFNNLTEGANTEDHFCMMNVLIVMVLNNFIHIFLTYYFENVIQGDHGISKPWNFLFCSKKKSMALSHNSDDKNSAVSEDESSYSTKNVGIKLQNLGKKFKQFGVVKSAVKNLNLNIYEGHITVLLGKFD